MKKIGIVILNYLAYQDTIECTNSILEQTFQNFEIVIIDNCSPNESFEKIFSFYDGNERIQVVRLEENVGFAKGNNYGISILKEKGIYNIFVVNGDTVFTERDFLSKISGMKFDENIAMVGTRILTKEGMNQNPEKVIITNKKKLDKVSFEYKLTYFFLKIKALGIIRKIFFPEIIQEHKNLDDNNVKVLNPLENKLHGSAIFFTENYLKNYCGFYPDTFLYLEEEILALICRKNDLRQMYVPSCSIYHKEDVSTTLLLGNNGKNAYLFKLKEILKSLKLMRKLMNLSPDEIKKRMKT